MAIRYLTHRVCRKAFDSLPIVVAYSVGTLVFSSCFMSFFSFYSPWLNTSAVPLIKIQLVLKV